MPTQDVTKREGSLNVRGYTSIAVKAQLLSVNFFCQHEQANVRLLCKGTKLQAQHTQMGDTTLLAWYIVDITWLKWYPWLAEARLVVHVNSGLSHSPSICLGNVSF